jgi:hypothetical protein
MYQKYLKPVLAAAAFVGLAAMAPAANAGTDIDVYLGLGGDPGYASGYYVDPDFHRPHWHRISCGEGRERVKWAGFRRVRPLDCSGRRFTYRASKRGDIFVVSVSSRSGRIISVRELYWP